jgi:hypothetical protein
MDSADSSLRACYELLAALERSRGNALPVRALPADALRVCLDRGFVLSIFRALPPIEVNEQDANGQDLPPWQIQPPPEPTALISQEGLAALSEWRLHAEAHDTQPVAPAKTKMTWQDAADRLERFRAQGEPFTSQPKLAKQLGCSPGTVNTAIRETPSLHGWAHKQAAPRAQSITEVVTDSMAQGRELNPADDAAIREYLEQDLTPDERAFFNSLSREDQLVFLDDPDAHGLDEQPRVRGRKP